MRNKIERRRDWLLGLKLKKKLTKQYPHCYKVCSDFGYGDGCTIGESLDIASALILLTESRSYDSDKVKLIDLFSDSSPQSICYTMYHALDQSNTYYIVEQLDVRIWEKPDFDAGSI